MSIGFNQIVDIKKWQKIQDHFSQVLRVTLCTVDKKGTLLTDFSSPSRICEEVMRSSLKGMMICKDCLKINYEEKEKDWKEGFFCKAELFYFFSIPLKVKNQTLAYLLVGPVILGKPHLEIYKKKIQNLDIDFERFLDALREVKSFSFYGIRSIIELLYDISRYICELGYQNLILSGLFPQASQITQRVHTFYTERLLNALLDVSYDFVKAERASLMLLDEEKSELYIKVAKGLDKKIIEKTRLRIGEGLAGLVAERKKPLFIGEKVEDQLIKSRLINPHLKYSILLPIKIKEKVVGVLNISSSQKPSENLSSQNIKTVDELVRLVETALTGLS